MTRPNQGKVEDEVAEHLAHARDLIQDMHPDEGAEHRLVAIEETLSALAVYLDMAFAEMRGESVDD
jgi:hypothetical protein